MKDSKNRWHPYSQRDKYPCRDSGVDCKNRKPGCQDTCIEMLAAKISNESRKKIEHKKRDIDNGVNEIKQHGYCSVKRLKPRER